jgi:hypothetical protein
MPQPRQVFCAFTPQCFDKFTPSLWGHIDDKEDRAMASAKQNSGDKTDKDAVTVDWIILTAAVVGLAVVSLASIQAGSDGLAANLGNLILGYSLF